ncbi:MAG: putative sigma-54 modulation protein [Mariniblastus sp.]|jgi:putative sigma-54 modulation protein
MRFGFVGKYSQHYNTSDRISWDDPVYLITTTIQKLGDGVEIKVTARHGQLSDDIQETMKSKVAKLPRFFDRTTGIQVLADLEHSGTPKVEIIVSAEETNDFFASDTGSNVIVALDSAISKIEQQLKKHKEKLISHRNRDHKIPEESAE